MTDTPPESLSPGKVEWLNGKLYIINGGAAKRHPDSTAFGAAFDTLFARISLPLLSHKALHLTSLPSSSLPTTHSLTIEADIATAGFNPAQAAPLSMGRIPRALSFSDIDISLRPLFPFHDLLSNVNPLPCSATFPSLLVYPIPILFPFFHSFIFEPRLLPWLASHPVQ